MFTPINPRGPDADFGSNPILFEAAVDGALRKMVGAGQKNGMFWALDRMTGDTIWQRQLGPGSPLTGGVLNNGAFDGVRLLVANNDPRSNGTVFALDPSDGAIAWQRELTGWVWAPITVSNGVGIVSADTDLTAFDTATGEELFRFHTAGTIACAATIVGGRVHFGSGMQHIVGTVDRRLYLLGLPGDMIGTVPTPVPTTSAGTTFSAIYEDIFVGQGCNSPFCHGANAGELSLATKEETYQALVGVAAAGAPCAASGMLRVARGNPADSLLWEKISTRTPRCGDPMPIADMLPDADVERIRAWIERGAPDD